MRTDTKIINYIIDLSWWTFMAVMAVQVIATDDNPTTAWHRAGMLIFGFALGALVWRRVAMPRIAARQQAIHDDAMARLDQLERWHAERFQRLRRQLGIAERPN
jgi:hypothetical protein